MFQTGIIIGLQSIASEFWTVFFRFWTTLGFPIWIAVLVLIFLFGVRFRHGFILLQAVLWNGLIIGFCKEIFALPRPWFVDAQVLNLSGNNAPSTVFVDRGARGFLGQLPIEVVNAYRAQAVDSWGFPSGHTSSSVALWGTAALMFRKKSITALAAAMMIFIPLSRMYLGRHFLADILTGYLLGFLVLLIFYFGLYAWDGLDILTPKSVRLRPGAISALPLYSLGLVLPLLLCLVPHVHHGGLGVLWGLNLAFLRLHRIGLPQDSATLSQRGARVATALLLFLGSYLGMRAISNFLFDPEPAAVYFLRLALVGFLVLWGATRFSLRQGWYQTNQASTPIP